MYLRRCIFVLFFMLCFTLQVHAYSDVNQDAWYSDAVQYVSDNGLMSGTGHGEFSPGMTFSRAMFAQVLYRLHGSPSGVSTHEFVDVSQNSWYSDAVNWVYDTGLMSGYGKGLFGPNDPVTREQLAVVLYRNETVTGDVDNRVLNIFRDSKYVSWWSEDAVAWAVTNSIISGSGLCLNPNNGATRAEVAQILTRYCSREVSQDTELASPYLYVEDGVVHTCYNSDKKLRFKFLKDGEEVVLRMESGKNYRYTFPMGLGGYELRVYENTHDSYYRIVMRELYTLDETEWSQSLVSSSSYFDMVPGIGTIVNSIWDDSKSDFDNVHAVFEWICSNISYDYNKMEDVLSTGYLPDLKTCLYNKKGICLDYASLFATMLRYKSVPCNVVVGYYNEATCHAWSRFFYNGEWFDVDTTFGASLYGVRERYFALKDSKYAEDYVL